MLTENVSTLKIHKLTQAQYDRELAAGRLDENALYLTPDDNMNGIIVSVNASDWVAQENGTYTNTVPVDGLTGDEIVDINLYGDNVTEEQSEAFDVLVKSIDTQEGCIVLTATEAISVSFDIVLRGRFDVQGGTGGGGVAITELKAKYVEYDNKFSGLKSTNAQDAIDELATLFNGTIITVPADGWVAQEDGTYTNTVLVESLTGGETFDALLHGDVTEEQSEAFDVFVTSMETQEGKIIFTASQEISVSFDVLLRGKVDINIGGGTGISASRADLVEYDNTNSKLAATDIQSAVDELASAINGMIVTVPTDAWVAQEDGTYTNTIAVEQITGNETFDVNLYEENATEEQIKAFGESVISVVTNEGQIVVTASEQINVSLRILLRGKIDFNNQSVVFVKDLNNYVGHLSNPNLLINGDFQVWQRGTSFSEVYNTYTADRWCLLNGNGQKHEKVNNGIKITPLKGSYVRLLQFIEGELKQGAYTLTMVIDGKKDTKVFSSIGNGEAFDFSDNRLFQATLYYSNGNTVLQLHYDTTSSTVIEYVKLEQGSVATPFVPRLYAEELALCQRYYVEYIGLDGRMLSEVGSKYAYFSIALPCALRVIPIATRKSNTVVYFNGTGTNEVTVNGTEVTNMTNNIISFRLSGDFGLSSWTISILYNINFVLDAEIY